MAYLVLGNLWLIVGLMLVVGSEATGDTQSFFGYGATNSVLYFLVTLAAFVMGVRFVQQHFEERARRRQETDDES